MAWSSSAAEVSGRLVDAASLDMLNSSLGIPDHTAKGPSRALLSCVSEVPRSRTAVSEAADAVAMHKRMGVKRGPRGRSRSSPFQRNIARLRWLVPSGDKVKPQARPQQRRRPSSTNLPRSAQAPCPTALPAADRSFVRNRTETPGFFLRADLQSLETIVKQTSAALLELIKCALRANYDEVNHDPLPQRWLDLINDLDRRERAETRQRREEDKRSARHARHAVH